MSSKRDYNKTNIYIVDKNLWKWAKYRSDILGLSSVSDYLFQLIMKDKKSIKLADYRGKEHKRGKGAGSS